MKSNNTNKCIRKGQLNIDDIDTLLTNYANVWTNQRLKMLMWLNINHCFNLKKSERYQRNETLI